MKSFRMMPGTKNSKVNSAYIIRTELILSNTVKAILKTSDLSGYCFVKEK